MGWIKTEEVLGKLRQVMNEVLELKAEESARSIELIKQLGALNNRIDGLATIVGTLDERQKSHTTMIELLGKKVNEIGKTVDDHFESFVKVSDTDSELFKLIAQALTGKVMEEEASAEPKLTEKAKKNERRKTKKNEGAKEAVSEAKKTVSGTDGNGGERAKGKNRGRPCKVEDSDAVIIEGYVHANRSCRTIHLCAPITKALKEFGFTRLIFYRHDNKKFYLRFGNDNYGAGWTVNKHGRIYYSKLARGIDKSDGSDFFCRLTISKGEASAIVMLNKKGKE